MTLIEEWMNSKKKTYWRVWECTTTDYEEGTWQWVLFWMDENDERKTAYEYGLGLTPDDCETAIKETIQVRLRNLNLL